MTATVCLPPAADMGLVEGLLGSVECNVLSMAEAGYGAFASPGSPVSIALTILLTLYIAMLGFRMMIGRAPLMIGDLTMTALKIGAVLALATSWPTYQQLVFDTLFRGPEQLGAGMLDAVQPASSMLGSNPLQGLQTAYNEMQESGAFLSQRSVGQISPFQGGNGFGAFALNMASFLLLMTTLGVILTAKIVLGLLLALGPIFVACLLFDSTRGLFEGWLRAAVAFALAPMLAVLCLVGQLMLLEPHLLRLAEARAQGVVDLAPTSSILLLSMIFTGVAFALAVATGMIASGFKLPRAAAISAPNDTDLRGFQNQQAQSPGVEAAFGQAQARAQPRADTIAAAAAAMERRDNRLFESAEAAPRRPITLRAGEPVVEGHRHTPLGQTFRRTAQPHRARSSVRRDR